MTEREIIFAENENGWHIHLGASRFLLAEGPLNTLNLGKAIFKQLQDHSSNLRGALPPIERKKRTP